MSSEFKTELGIAHQVSLFITDSREAYRQIRNYLAGRLVGATRDKTLLEEVIN